MKAALIVIDMIHDFVTGKFGFKGALEIVPRIQQLLASARARGVLVIHARDAHRPGDPELRIWGEHAMAGSKGSEIIPELKPIKGEPIISKHTYDVFQVPRLRKLLREKGVEVLVLTGVVTEICIQHSAAGAFFNGYKVVISEDGVASPDRRAKERSLDYMRKIYGAKITNSQEIIKGWER
ncbi:MAG: cysteine hydrolase family protein [Candidatus Hadarchaeum sp.]|uniref:cysteine hydrolase family protein n=1 Tax=Candidatus Hadarchaeum sp. TaxID=2883567 RepID=UPI003D0E1659